MNTKVKEEWLAALRSGKYKQAKKLLHNDDGYCCLGVLCDLHAQEHGNKWVATKNVDDRCHSYLSSKSLPPLEVITWAGFAEKNLLHNENCANIRLGKTVAPIGDEYLAAFNDRGVPFSEIADLIDKHL